MHTSVTLAARVSGVISTTLPASQTSEEEEEAVRSSFSSSSSRSTSMHGLFCPHRVLHPPCMRRPHLFAPSWFLPFFSIPTASFSTLHRFPMLPLFIFAPRMASSFSSSTTTTAIVTPSWTLQKPSPVEDVRGKKAMEEEGDDLISSLLLFPSSMSGIDSKEREGGGSSGNEAWLPFWKDSTSRGSLSWRRRREEETERVVETSGASDFGDPHRSALWQAQRAVGVGGNHASFFFSVLFSRPRWALVGSRCGVPLSFPWQREWGTPLCTALRWAGSIGNTSPSNSHTVHLSNSPTSGTSLSGSRRHAGTSPVSSAGSSSRRPSGGGSGSHHHGRRMKARRPAGGGGTSRQGSGTSSSPLSHTTTTTSTAAAVSTPSGGNGASSTSGSRNVSGEAPGSSGRIGSSAAAAATTITTTLAAVAEAMPWFTTGRKKSKKSGRGKRGKRAVILPGGVSVGDGGGGGGSAVTSLLSCVAREEGILPLPSASSRRRRGGSGSGERSGRGPGGATGGPPSSAGKDLQRSGLTASPPLSAGMTEASTVGGGNRHAHSATTAPSHPHAVQKNGKREKKWKTRKMRFSPQKSTSIHPGEGEGTTTPSTPTTTTPTPITNHSRSSSASVRPLTSSSSTLGTVRDGQHRSQSSSSSTSSTSRGSPLSPSVTAAAGPTARRQVPFSSLAARPSTSLMTSGNAPPSSTSSFATAASVSAASLPIAGHPKKNMKSITGKKRFKLRRVHRAGGREEEEEEEKNSTMGKTSTEVVGKNALRAASTTTTTTTTSSASFSGPTMRKIVDSTTSWTPTSTTTTTSGGGGHASSKSGKSSSTSSSSTPSGLTSPKKSLLENNPLLFPDYREQVLRIFQQLLEVNNALGEVYKAKSYHFALQELRRGDHIFRVLPPNLLPLPREQANLSDWLSGHMELEAQHSDMIANWEKRVFLMEPSSVVSGMGDKLKGKIIEILQTGDLEELHSIYKRPEVSAMREICKVHGFGPRTALSLFRKHKIKTVGELKKLAASSSSSSSGISLNDGQKLGLAYFDDIQRRIPHEEGKLHEAYLKSRLKKHFGSAFSLVVCGSFRRRTEYSGDIDILLTPHVSDSPSASVKGGGGGGGASSSSSSALLVPPQNAVRAFVEALKEDKYIQATFALGSTKFMGMGRLSGTPSPAIGKAILLAEQLMLEEEARNRQSCGAEKTSSGGSVHSSSKATKGSPTIYPARRIDVRYVDALSFPAASLYFTGSKNFNVVMRARAVKMHLVLNEYGLFKQDFAAAANAASAVGDGSSKGSGGGGSSARPTPLSSVNELITRLTKYAYWSRGAELFSSPTTGSASSSSGGGSGSSRNSSKGHSGGKKGKGSEKKGGSTSASDSSGLVVLDESKQRDLQWLVKNLEYLRVPAGSEQDIFTALGMVYVEPWERCW